jgi:hypothetical protein
MNKLPEMTKLTMQIVGHSTEHIHRRYAHLEVHDLRRAMESALPDVTATAKKGGAK